MKQELPISMILLALGACCWFQFPTNQSKQSSRAEIFANELDGGGNGVASLRQSHERPNFSAGSIVQASWQAPASDTRVAQPIVAGGVTTVDQTAGIGATGSLPAMDDGTPMRAFAPAEFLQIAAANVVQATDATNAIVQAANGIQQLPSFATRTKVNSRLFGVSMVATGKYFQADGGKKSRMEIQYTSPMAKTVLQMSDGRFVYFLKSDQQQHKLEFIDLFRLANDRGKAQGGLLPTTWVMGGGIGKAVSHYTDSFDFQKVTSLQQSQSAPGVTTYRGIWKAGVLLHLIHAGMPDADRPSRIVWADVPRQLPHAIELTFSAAEGETAVPKQISFFKFSTEKERSMVKEMVRIEFSPFEFKTELPDELFTLESTDFEATDITKVYQAQILKLSQGMDKVANQSLPSQSQTPADLR